MEREHNGVNKKVQDVLSRRELEVEVILWHSRAGAGQDIRVEILLILNQKLIIIYVYKEEYFDFYFELGKKK